jgi:hypothetical protein
VFVIGSACTVDETAPDGGGAGQGGEAPSLGGTSGASDSVAGTAGESTSSSAGASGAAAGTAGARGGTSDAVGGGAAGSEGGVPAGAGGEVAAAGGYAAEGGAPATTPEPPPWQPPPGCKLVSEGMRIGGGCSVTLSCAAQRGTFTCAPQTDGTWQCRTGYGRADTIGITGLVGLGACHSAVNFFLTGEDDVFSGEDVCTLEYESSTTACRRSRPCERSAAPDSGISGKLTHRKTINCSGTPLRCSCDTGSL